MSIIVRPILLHNEYVPAKTGEREWDYRMFGHHDGMTLGNFSKPDSAASFESLFDICENHDREKHNYFTQILFGFHENEKKESDFWKTDLPFLYISLLQIKSNEVQKCVQYLESKELLEKELKILGCIEQKNEIEILTYYSLDNSDLILMIKCMSAKTGQRFINSLHQNGERHPFILRNSYSILGICAKDIEQGGERLKEDEKIEFLELKIVEKYSNSICAVYQELKSKLSPNGANIRRMAMLGTEDETILIQNAAWKDLLPFYQKGDGILCNSNEKAAKYSTAISTKVMIDIPENEKWNEVESKEVEMPFYEMLIEKVKEVYLGADDENSKTERKNLMQIVNALWRFEYSYWTEAVFSDYNFFPIYLPIYTLVELLKNVGNTWDKSYYDFMMSIKLRTQNFTKPDRVYAQLTDFNIRYFDIPAKVVALYSAYIYYLKKALNTQENVRYEFLISPGVSDTTRVVELFPMTSKKERLMLISMPERQTYNIKLMFIILGHEIAHFVGRDVRLRDDRKERMIRMCSRVVCKAMKCHILDENEGKHWVEIPEHWSELEEKLEHWFIAYMNREMENENYLKDKYGEEDYPKKNEENNETESNKEDSDRKEINNRTDILEKILNNVIERVLLDKGELLFRFAIWDQFQEEQKTEPKLEWNTYYNENREWIQRCIDVYLGERYNKDDSLSAGNAIHTMLYLFKECYADVICILSLHLSVKDYLGALKESIRASKWTMNDIEDTILIPRIALVMQSISYPLEIDDAKIDFRWTDKEFEQYSEEDEPEIYFLEIAARQFVANYMMPQEETDKMIPESGGSVVYDRNILLEILSYLINCQKAFFEMLNGKEEHKKLDRDELTYIRQFYSLTNEKESDLVFDKYMKLLKKYEEDIYKDIEQLAEQENENRKRNENG